MDVFLANFFLFNHVLFMLIHTNDFLNLIEIMNWVFAIEVSILFVRIEWLRKCLGGCFNLYNFRI